jgi:signal transduction histidine kinase
VFGRYRDETMTQPGSPTVPGSGATVLLRQFEHVMFVGLLALGIALTVARGVRAVPGGAMSVALLGWYGLGIALMRHRRDDRRAAVTWLSVLCVGWLALIALSAEFVWLLFPISLLLLQLLPVRWSVPVVAGLTAVGIVGVAWHQGGLSVAVVLGPMIGAAVSVMISLVFRQLREESERRARLVAELTAAQQRLAAAERYAGTVAERERLAHEIHDTLAQSLSSIVLLLRSVDAAAAGLPVPARQQLAVATDAARDALQDTRRLVRTLEPSGLDGQPLADALSRLVEQVRPVGVEVGLRVDGDPYDLPTPVAVALLRTGQGALGNVVAHSLARRAQVTVTFQPGLVSLDIADDGVGFDVGAPRAETSAGTGIGLAAMSRRLAAVGGTLTVESAPGDGTAISASIPLGNHDG